MMKILLSGAAGGHLDELLSIKPAFDNHNIALVTTKNDITKNLDGRVYYIPEFIGNVDKGRTIIYIQLFLYYIILTYYSLYILIAEKPNLIVCCGGEASLWLTYLGKIMGMKVMYLETINRVTNLSLTGKFVYPFVDVFIVQWEGLLQKYPMAKFWGRVI